ncbi:MAG: hypothetical protein JSV62_01010 [Promethearchaeota archaeon]|nr:MAG: hypothetical protein JSV62_01010 [Candidatus Lokiarchaeota archaeon]
MVKVYNSSEEYSEYDKKKNRKIIIEEGANLKSYLNIWDVNPSYKDISRKFSLIKTIFFIILSSALIISMYILTNHLIASVGLGIGFCVAFIIVFHDEFYFLKNFFSYSFRNKIISKPFEDLVFWYHKDDTSTLYFSNRRDLLHIALKIYQIKVIAENVHSAINQFVKALGSEGMRLSYSYQIVQKPTIKIFNKESSRVNTLKSLQSRGATIYFSVYTKEKGNLSNRTLEQLHYRIVQYANNLKSNIVSNFHHFKTVLLSGNALMNAVRTFYLKDKTSIYETPIAKRYALKSNNSHKFWKLIMCSILVFYFDFFILWMKLLFIYIFPINFGILLAIILLWWRSTLFQFSKTKLIHDQNIVVAKPFDNMKFYRIRQYPHSIFFHVENELLIGMKMVNLKCVYESPFCLLGKFIEALNNHNVNFSYTLKNRPISYYLFEHSGGLKYLKEKIRKGMLWDEETMIKTQAHEEKWLGIRSGMWFTMLTMSVNSYRYTDIADENSFEDLENDLDNQVNVLKGAFGINFQSYVIEDVRSSNLHSGYLFSTLKHNLFRLNGTHLNYVMFQGARMYPLTDIVDILKKGERTEIAAEFNTPLYLDNFITIGNTINTEVLETEVPFGFTLEQLHNLFITNGIPEHRELLAMKIVSELIKTRNYSLIFDFNGAWSKLLDYFKDTIFQEEILYFKYGSSFIIDPIKSDIPYDPHHTDYLEYIYDAFGLALKRDERIVEMFRHTIQKNPEMDLGTIQMQLKNQSEWEKTPVSDLLLSVFADFTPNELIFFQNIQKDGITVGDFLTSSKTVIIDLSVFRELKKKLFVTFVLVSKLIHYITYQEKYLPKFIYIPYIDVFFDSYFLNLRKTYDKIDIFLKPLIERKFGLIFSAHQIRHLHPNSLLYFNNYITLRATDNRDIGILKNELNLQELEGQGYYTQSRKHAYQIFYLRNLKKNIILTRRDDIDQPFPAIIDWKDIDSCPKWPYEEIVKFMNKQGYDIKFSEKTILENVKETLFEIDLGHYYIYIETIIRFMDSVLTVDQIGNLYRKKLEEQLKKFIYPALAEKTQNKEHMKKIRNNILDVLIKHGYLVENHPKRAGGGESLRTSFSVGPRYQEALEDYYKVKGRKYRNFQVEVLDKESLKFEDFEKIFPMHSRKYIIQEENLKEALSREIGDLYYNIFKIYRYIAKNNYSIAIKTQMGLLKGYLRGVYRHFYNKDTVVQQGFNSFLTILEKTEGFPFSKQELIDYIDQFHHINLEVADLEVLANEMYHSISTFFSKIQQFINE